MKFNLNEEKIINLYKNSDLTHSDIAKIYKCNHWNIMKILHKHNIIKDRKETNGLKVWFEKETEDKMIDLYLKKNESQCTVAKKFNTKRWIIRRILKERKIELKSAENIARKYEYDDKFLDKINCKEKAIFLGLFFADGTNTEKGITISLQEKDKEYLDFFNKIIFKDRKLYISNSAYNKGYQKTYILSICDKRFSEQMSLYGGIPRKSLTLEWPKNLSDEYIFSFIQGYFEGDGCISKHTQIFKHKTKNKIHIYKGTYYRIQILGTFNFLSKMKEILEKKDIKSIISKDKSKIYLLRINKQTDIIKFYNLIYIDSPIVMKRKYNIFQELLQDFKNKSFFKKINEIIISEKQK